MDTTPRLGDSDNALLFKIAEALNDGAVSGITQVAADARYVLKSGDTVTGTLNIGVESTDNGFFALNPDAAAPYTQTRRVADNAPAIVRVQKRGTTGDADEAPSVNDNLVRYDFYAWDGSAYNPGAVLQATAGENWTGSARGTRLTVNIVANGGSTTTEMLRMTAAMLDLRNNAVLGSGGVQVVSSRKTGWVAATGSVSRATFDTATVTTTQLAQRFAALLDDLISHGLIGPA